METAGEINEHIFWKREQGKRRGAKNTEESQCDAGLKLGNDEARTTKNENSVQPKKAEEGKTKSGLILETGFEPLNWLPSLQKKDSLAELIIGGPNSW